MLTSWIGGILARDLRALRREIEAYPNERDLWQVQPGITNSAGNLALHLAGNLQYFVGAVLGGTGYVRDRDARALATATSSRGGRSPELAPAVTNPTAGSAA